MVREGRIFTSVNTDPDFGASYKVTAYEVGAQVTGTPTATTIACASVAVAAGDILINLAADGETVAGTPNYDGNGLAVYTDMFYGNQAVNNTVQCDANGRFRYFHKGLGIWELVRTTAGVPFSFFLDAGISAVTGPDSTTDNAVVRWDGTTGETTQNSAVLVGDTGAVTGVTSLAMGGALSGVTTLAASGTSTLAAVTASGLVTASAGVAVPTGQAVALSGTTTLAVGGASTLAAVTASGLITGSAGVTISSGTSALQAITGTTLVTTGNVTSGGHIRGPLASEALTSSAAIATAGRFLIDITNTSGTNTPTLVAPSSVDGQILILRCVALTAGTMTLADSGNVSLSAAWVPNAFDTLTLVASGVVWYELARSAN